MDCKLTFDAGVAHTSLANLELSHRLTGVLGKQLSWQGLRHVHSRAQLLCAAGYNSSIENESLDQPVVIVMAGDTRANTSRADIKVTILTGAAVEVFVWNGLVAVVAVNTECAAIGVMERVRCRVLDMFSLDMLG